MANTLAVLLLLDLLLLDLVVVLDDLSGGDIENVNPAAFFYKGSILDVDLINTLFEAYNFDYVYHLAAYAAEGLSPFIRNFNYQNNQFFVENVSLAEIAKQYSTPSKYYQIHPHLTAGTPQAPQSNPGAPKGPRK